MPSNVPVMLGQPTEALGLFADSWLAGWEPRGRVMPLMSPVSVTGQCLIWKQDR